MNYLDDIDHVEKTLADHPLAGEKCPTNKRPLMRRTTSSKYSYSVFYVVNDESNPTAITIVALGKGIPAPK